MKKIALILAGGGGTRLQPLSTPEIPKQFLRLFGSKTLFRETIERVKSFDEVVIVSNKSLESLIVADTDDLDNVRYVWEPASRNTAPAVALAIRDSDPDAVVLMFPCDHYIVNNDEFKKGLSKAIHSADMGYIISIGIKPTEPSPHFGYVLGDQFVEKPTVKEAIELINKGYYWNSGIYAFKVSQFNSILKMVIPAIYQFATQDDFIQCPNISFDKAISERTSLIRGINVNFEWSDIGTFEGLFKVISKIAPNNLEYDERPWGNYQVLRDDDIFKMKLLTVDAGESISLQYHNHRSEIWYILEGDGTFINQDYNVDNPLECNEQIYSKGQVIQVPVKNLHRITAKTTTKIFEIQQGSYMGEDDIVRLQDLYGRK